MDQLATRRRKTTEIIMYLNFQGHNVSTEHDRFTSFLVVNQTVDFCYQHFWIKLYDPSLRQSKKRE